MIGDDPMFLYKKLSPKAYNLVLGGMILYGLAANILMCLLCGPIFRRMNPIALLLGELVISIIGIFCGRSSNLKVRFLGYYLIVIPFGAVLSAVLPAFAAEAVFLAIVLTAVVTVGMIALSALFPAFFSRLGPALGIALLLSLAVDIITWLLGYPLSVFTVVYVVLFSLYLGYDWHKAQSCYKDVSNAIESAIDLYLDITNLFLDLLRLIDLSDLFD